MTTSWKPAVKVMGEDRWCYNSLRFATEAEALASAKDLHGRWMATTDFTSHASDDPPNYRWDAEQGLVSL